MANESHLKTLLQGVEAWNRWRDVNRRIKPDLSGSDITISDLRGVNLRGTNLREANLCDVDLFEADLSGADLSDSTIEGAHLSKANFQKANLSRADLQESTISQTILNRANLSHAQLQGASLNGAYLIDANLKDADLSWATLVRADLSEANLREADLTDANLREADLSRANLTGAILAYASLVRTTIEQAVFTDCLVYGISAWDLIGQPRDQSNLAITSDLEVTVDNLEVAQFIYLLLYNERIRQVIDAVTLKVVLILGRFTVERKAVLDAIREALRHHDYLPVLFDFEKPDSRSTVETILLLTRMARFVIADVTDAKSILQELQAIVPTSPSVPIQPLLLTSQLEPGMFDFLKRFPWVLPTYEYESPEALISSLETEVIQPAETKANHIRTS